MSGAEAVIAIQLVVAAIAVAGSIASAVISRKALGNAVPDPDLKKHPTADEGAAAAWLFGTKNRVSGQLIYLSDTRLVPISGASKGKTTQIAGWNYKVDVAIAWCRTECDPDPINRIWASGELIYAREHTANLVIPESFWQPRIVYGAFDFWHIGGQSVSDHCAPEPIHPRQRAKSSFAKMFFTTTKGTALDAECNLVASQMLHVSVTVAGAVVNPENNGTFNCTHWRAIDHPTDNTLQRWEVHFFRGSYTYPTIESIIASGGSPTELCDPINDPGLAGVGTELTMTLAFTVTGVSQYFPAGFLTT